MSQNKIGGLLLSAMIFATGSFVPTLVRAQAADRVTTSALKAKSTVVSPEAGQLQSTPVPQSPREYRIGPGDILGVEVWKEPEASAATVTVRLDGKLSLPMLGELTASGLTPTELESLLTTKYAEYVLKPAVTVIVKEINSQKVYVIGEVKKEGEIRVEAPLTVLQALAQSGGLTDYAKRKKIYVLRAQPGGQGKMPFHYDSVCRGKKMGQNILVVSGDTIVVPR